MNGFASLLSSLTTLIWCRMKISAAWSVVNRPTMPTDFGNPFAVGRQLPEVVIVPLDEQAGSP
jgi:hypothetical protein